MSRSSDARRAASDDGFSLLEVLVSLAVITTVMLALLPQLITGIKASGTATWVTVAKGLAQGQVERMRNLPFYVAPSAGDYRDVLDFHYRDRVAPQRALPCTGTPTAPYEQLTGYVATTARCAFEPQTGPFYRWVALSLDSDFLLVVDTQFLSSATPPVVVEPPVAYSSQDKVTLANSRPPARQVGVTVTVLRANRATTQPVTVRTQIAEETPTPVRLSLSGSVTALEVGGNVTSAGPASLAAGVVSLRGDLTSMSRIDASLAAVTGAVGEQPVGAASATVSGPPDRTTGTTTEEAAASSPVPCQPLCWGANQVRVGPVSALDARPSAGLPPYPMQALVTGTTVDGSMRAVLFAPASDSAYRQRLRLEGPLVSLVPGAGGSAVGPGNLCAATGTGVNAYVRGAGYLRTTDEVAAVDPMTAEACVLAQTSRFALFPTTFAPAGVVQVELGTSSARCLVSGTAHTADTAVTYSARVWVWTPSDLPLVEGSYELVAEIDEGDSADPLAAVDLTRVVRPDLLGTAAFDPRRLGDYVASWSGLRAADVDVTEETGSASVTVPGVVTISSQPLLPGTVELPLLSTELPEATNPLEQLVLEALDLVDPASTVALSFGSLGCSAQDAR